MAPENEAEGSPAEEAGESKETETTEEAEDNPSIENIAALGDAELHDLLGHHKELQEVRKGLAEAAKLTGKAREHAENRVQDWFKPKVYPGDFKYLAEDALRATAEKKKFKEALNDTSPTSVIN